MNENEILEAEITLGGGEKNKLKIQESDDWSEIKKGTRAIMCLVNGQQFVVEIQSACEEEGVFFKPIGSSQGLHYDGNVVGNIYVEVSE
jgi:hypothetical protein